MLFQEGLPGEVREHGRRFTLQNILSIPASTCGVYVFHYKRAFVYVGKSQSAGQGIRERLTKHYNGSHSERLTTWIRALDGDVHFTYMRCEEAQTDDLERSLIHFLQPMVNVERYSDYQPKPTYWRERYG